MAIANEKNTRPAPAATDTGLVTAVTVRVEDAGDAGITAQVDDLITEERGLLELVTRSQAERIISAKDVLLDIAKQWARDQEDRANRLQADNAAQAARIKELEKINANLMGDDEDKQRYTTKRLKQEIARATEALEADLAVMREALGDLVSWFSDPSEYGPWIIKSGKHGADDAVEHARAVLGGKSS